MRFLSYMFFSAAALASLSVAAQGQSLEETVAEGKILYEQSCLACHQADGSGVPGLAPPLVEGTFVNGKKKALVNIILKGMEGVEIKGEQYANPMPAFDYMSDEEVATVLTYVKNAFDNNGGSILASEVKQMRKTLR